MSLFLPPPTSENESERLQVLHSYGVLDTPQEVCFDELTEFACAIFGVPEAQVTLVDADRQYIKASARALAGTDLPRSHAFCPHTIGQDEVLIVLDALHDERFCNNPFVAGEPYVRFYAGFPLLVVDGHKLGAFCLLSPEPRAFFSQEEQGILKRLARQASAYVEKRALEPKELPPDPSFGSSSWTSPTPAGECTGLLLLTDTFHPLYANKVGKQWLGEASVGDGYQHHSLVSVLVEAKSRRVPLSMQTVLGSTAYAVEVWPVASHLAVFLREILPIRPAAGITRQEEEEQERLTRLMNTAPPLFWTLNPEEPSEADLQDLLQYTGMTFAEFCNGQYLSFVHPEDVARTRELMARATTAGTVFESDLRVRRFDGVYRWLHAQARPRFKLQGSIKAWVGVHTDVTEKHALQAALQESHERFELATQAATEGVWDLKCSTGQMYYSAHLQELLGLDTSASSAQDWLERICPEDLDRLQQHWQTVEASQSTRYESEFRCVLAEGGWRWLRVRAVCLRDSEGRLVRLTGTASDISTQRLKDPLTGLHNRSSLLDQLLWRIHKADELSRNFALYFLDLDSFKQINDSLGHASGDSVIVEVARRLQAALVNTSGNVVARLGGDEFVVLAIDLEGEADAWSFGALLKELLSAPLQLAQSIRISASIGIAFGTPGKYASAEQMLEEADVAMYNAKSRGKGSIDMFTRTMRDAVIARLSLEQDLRRVLEENQLELRYQPQVDMRSGKILGVEALLRWKHPERGWVSPAEFIPVAEETRLIIPIGEWVLEQVLSQIQKWQSRSLLPKGFTVSINISAHQIRGRQFSEALLNRCRATGVDPHSLRLEVTEGAFISDLPAVTTELQSAARAGFELDLDDFGTGFSSLSYLQHFPFGSVKIDRSFVARMCRDLKSRSLVQTIVGLARSLSMGVIAEGVEDQEQAAALQAMGCNRAQGFLYSAAVTSLEIESLWLKMPLSILPSTQAAALRQYA